MGETVNELMTRVYDDYKKMYEGRLKDDLHGLAKHQLCILSEGLLNREDKSDGSTYSLISDFISNSIRISCAKFDKIPKSKREILSDIASFEQDDLKEEYYNNNDCFNVTSISDSRLDEIYNLYFSHNSIFKDNTLSAFVFLSCCIFVDETSDESQNILKKLIYKYLFEGLVKE
jgi:hypothetical protein